MKRLLLVMVAMWLSVLPALAMEPIPVPDAMLKCEQDSDCASVETSCSGCCQYAPIAIASQQAYIKLFQAQCTDYKGAVCRCRFPEKPVFTCEHHRCTMRFPNLPTR